MKVVKHKGFFLSLELFETWLDHGPEQQHLGPILSKDTHGAGRGGRVQGRAQRWAWAG